MSEMLVTSPELKKKVDDYDIVFDSGMLLPITLDSTLGDTIIFGEKLITVVLTSKTSLNDPTKTLPAEDITIFVSHIVSIQHRVREVVELTPEQKLDWQKAFKEATDTIQ